MTESYGDQVRRLRKERGLTQPQLAKAAGFSVRTLQDVEAGKSERPQRETRLKLAAILDIEGDADEERDSWSADVKLILDIIGAGLETMTSEGRLAWLRDVLKPWLGKQ